MHNWKTELKFHGNEILFFIFLIFIIFFFSCSAVKYLCPTTTPPYMGQDETRGQWAWMCLGKTAKLLSGWAVQTLLVALTVQQYCCLENSAIALKKNLLLVSVSELNWTFIVKRTQNISTSDTLHVYSTCLILGSVKFKSWLQVRIGVRTLTWESFTCKMS